MTTNKSQSYKAFYYCIHSMLTVEFLCSQLWMRFHINIVILHSSSIFFVPSFSWEDWHKCFNSIKMKKKTEKDFLRAKLSALFIVVVALVRYVFCMSMEWMPLLYLRASFIITSTSWIMWMMMMIMILYSASLRRHDSFYVMHLLINNECLAPFICYSIYECEYWICMLFIFLLHENILIYSSSQFHRVKCAV